MALIGSIIEKLGLSFIWMGNKKKAIKQQGGAAQVYQETGVTNIYNFEYVSVSSIQELAAMSIPQDTQQFLQAASKRFLAEEFTKQSNFKTIVEKADLQALPSPGEPDRDWFLKWVDVAKGVSREEIQNILAKILSGEVSKPQSYSLRTLDVLKSLDKSELEIFQRFCDVSFCVPSLQAKDFVTVLVDPMGGSAGDNCMSNLGLSYLELTTLQDAGLIKSDFNSWREFVLPLTFRVPLTIGSKQYLFKLQKESGVVDAAERLTCLNFTTAGLELRSALTLGTNVEYERKFIEWLKKWNLAPLLSV